MNDKDFIINAGPEGTFNRSGDYQTLPEDIDRMFDSYEQGNVRQIAIYFHGGLVKESSGLEVARNVEPYLTNAGYQPVCFVWETGLVETLTVNISKISETKLFRKLIKVLVKKLSGRLGFQFDNARGTGKELTDEEIMAELNKPAPFTDVSKEIQEHRSRGGTVQAFNVQDFVQEADLKTEFEREIDKDPEFKAVIKSTVVTTELQPGVRSRGIVELGVFVRSMVKIAMRVIKRFAKQRDHHFFPTIVEEILRELFIADLGAAIWGWMKDKADDIWKPNNGRAGLDQHVGRYFLDKLARYQADYPETVISLIGHSAGSIAICNLMKYVAAEFVGLKFKHIIFFAPACRAELFKEQLLANSSKYEALRIFTMADDFETKDMLVPYFYTHSLLYFISGVLEQEGEGYDEYVLGLNRHISGEKPYDIAPLSDIHQYLFANGDHRVVFSKTADGADEGLRSLSLKHGAFDDDESTLKSMVYFLKNNV